jgi:hypothetical protein
MGESPVSVPIHMIVGDDCGFCILRIVFRLAFCQVTNTRLVLLTTAILTTPFYIAGLVAITPVFIPHHEPEIVSNHTLAKAREVELDCSTPDGRMVWHAPVIGVGEKNVMGVGPDRIDTSKWICVIGPA